MNRHPGNQPTTKPQRARDRHNRQGLDRQLAIVADPSRSPRDRKRASRFAAALAEKLGLIERPERCQWCSRRLRLERHHEEHSRPLEVWWLCPSCHFDADHMASKERSA